MTGGLEGGFLERRRSQTFIWRFRNPVEKIWSILADTNRFNEAAGLPNHAVEERPRPDGGVDFIGRGKLGGHELRWRELPATWVANQWLVHERFFETGPLTHVGATLRLFPDGAGARGEYTLTAEARNWVGRLLLQTRFFASVEKSFGKLAEEADDFASGARELEFDYPPPRLQPGAAERLERAAIAIEKSAFGHGLGPRLTDVLTRWPEVDVKTLRPLALARRWKVEPRFAVESCLQAVREEALGMRWDLLCPRCQGAKASSPSLDALPTEAHCGSCNVSYGRDFSRNVELAFFPAQSIRLTDDKEFCLFGPMSTPHIKAQIRVPAGESLVVETGIAPGAYRLRTLEAGGEAQIDWRDGAFPTVLARLGAASDAPEGAAGPGVVIDLEHPSDPGAAADGTVTLRNETPWERVFIIEELSWRRDALTAERAMTLQAFSDLFDRDILRPGDHLEIDHVSFLFADIKGSTALYETVGDAQAYTLARTFFAILGAAIREQNGTLVKTIGDAVHAAFSSPADALACALQIQRDIAGHNARSGRTPLSVKIGLHAGRTIGVTLNSRLDYYGTAVNKCARLSDQSHGGDVTMSESFAADPATRDLLAPFDLSAETAPMKGLGGAVPFHRIPADQILADRPAVGSADARAADAVA